MNDRASCFTPGDIPTLEELQIIGVSESVTEFEQAISSLTGEPRSIEHSFHVDQLAAVLGLWGRVRSLDLQLGYLLQSGTPILVPTTMTSQTRVVWISSTSYSGVEADYLDHYEGLAPLAALTQNPDSVPSRSVLHGSDKEVDDSDALSSLYSDDMASDAGDSCIRDPPGQSAMDSHAFSNSDLSGWSDTDLDSDLSGLGLEINDLGLTKPIVEKAYVDENGYIRIGLQPVQSHSPFIHTALRKVTKRQILMKTGQSLRRIDRKIPGTILKELESTRDEMCHYLM